jgi:rhodanese-related sulfurtransferase
MLGLVLVAAAGIWLSRQTNKPKAALPGEISIAQAAQMRDQGAFILDVRQTEEWVQFHIPGSILIPLGDLPGRLAEVPRNEEIVVVCRSGNRSAQGRDILKQAGYTQVTSMAGGVTKWQAEGQPVASGQ